MRKRGQLESWPTGASSPGEGSGAHAALAGWKALRNHDVIAEAAVAILEAGDRFIDARKREFAMFEIRKVERARAARAAMSSIFVPSYPSRANALTAAAMIRARRSSALRRLRTLDFIEIDTNLLQSRLASREVRRCAFSLQVRRARSDAAWFRV